MREELRSHKLILGLIAGWIAIFLYVYLVIGAQSGEARVEAGAILLLTLVVAAALVYLGIGELIMAGVFGPTHRREFTAYLLLGTFSLVAGVVLVLTTMESLRMVSGVVAPFALLFGLAEVRMAQGLAHHRRQATALYICGSLECATGVVLMMGRWINEAQLVKLLALTGVVTMLQLLPFLVFRPRNIAHS